MESSFHLEKKAKSKKNKGIWEKTKDNQNTYGKFPFYDPKHSL